MKITEKEFLEAELKRFNLTMQNKEFVALAKEVSDYVAKFKPESVIDFGCGTGVYSETLRQNGFNIVAQDVFKVHRDYCKINYPGLKIIVKPRHAQIMLFIEVAEHMTDEEIVVAINAIKPKMVLFSSTPNTDIKNDENWGHINIKQHEDWVLLFANLGYKVLELPKTPTLWAITFEKI